MVLILKRRSSGYLKVKSETITSKFHGKKWSKTVNDNFLQTLIVLLLCFANCWRGTAATSSDGIITLPNTTTITLSQLNDICTNQTRNGYDTLKLLQVMHFDFCNEFHPVLFARTSNTSSSLTLKTYKVQFEKSKSLNFPSKNITLNSVYNCNNIQSLFKQESYFKKVFTDYSNLLDRTDECTIQKVINCSVCKHTYRQWACSQFASQYANLLDTRPVCPYLFAKVCHDCPSLEPEASYGGYSIFQCIKDDEIKVDCMNSITATSLPCISYSCIPSYNETTVSQIP